MLVLCIFSSLAISSEPLTKTVKSKKLVLNGTGVLKRYYFKVYQVSLYLNKASKDSKAIIKSDDVKYAKMKFLRDVKAQPIREGFRDSYKENCGNKCEQLRPFLKQLEKGVPNMKKGRTIEFTFDPKNVRIEVHGKGKIVIPSPDFGRVLLLTWIGGKAASKDLKSGVLGIK